ncbi:protein mab-21-like 3 [Mercenaria mercenaria]|uniref:protein mab-21-like 3 n=1 Tax=Mercenaria mercenaria TaxID=6596 RepID=UPI00234EA3DA|nr:protein mab-21-like 3 [Mercenaria mercenaria]
MKKEMFISAHQQNLYTDRKLVQTDVGSSIPTGYAVVDVQKSETPPEFIHMADTSSTLRWNYYSVPILLAGGPSSAFQSGDAHTEVINKSTQSGCIHIIPRDVKQDLHQKIKRAKNGLGLDDVSISNTSQGPALTLTISPKTQDIRHNISVDITASLKCASKLKLEDFGWPRLQTKKAFDKEVIDAAIESGIHLVPKKDLFWSISFSRAERALLSSIDRGFGCRKRVLKLLKKFVEKCKSGSTSKLPGISSHILKTQILWSCELHADETFDYWNFENRDNCLIKTMEELENSLRRRNLPEYFNASLNVLEKKEPAVLCELANYLNSEMTKLKLMI